MKVRVFVPFKTYVPYVVEVRDLTPEAIAEALENKDPSDWEEDPNFYEKLGDEWNEVINSVELSDVEVLESEDRYVELKCPECGREFMIKADAEGVITCPYCGELVEELKRFEPQEK